MMPDTPGADRQCRRASLPATVRSALPAELDADVVALLGELAAGLPEALGQDLVGVYLWGSLTYDAFDPRSSDIDVIVVTRQDIGDRALERLQDWYDRMRGEQPWAARCDVRLAIRDELLDKGSRCCILQRGRFERTGSDGNPFICLNLAQHGIALYGPEPSRIAPAVNPRELRDGLLLELDYLVDGLTGPVADAVEDARRYSAYAVLTACRILYTASHGTMVSKERAADWAASVVPSESRSTIEAALEARLSAPGEGPPVPREAALAFVRAVAARAIIPGIGPAPEIAIQDL